MNFNIIYHLISFLFPKTEEKTALKQTCNRLQANREVLESRKYYQKTLKKIRNKKGKIKVGFIVSENCKWTYQSLYDLFQKSEKFEPIILITLLTSVHNGVDKTRYNSKENYDFFTNPFLRI